MWHYWQGQKENTISSSNLSNSEEVLFCINLAFNLLPTVVSCPSLRSEGFSVT
jgi:hypothetical protein